MYPYVSPQRFTIAMNEGLHLKRSTTALKEDRNQNHSNMSAQMKAGIFLLSHSQLPTSLNKIYGVDAKASQGRAEQEYASIKKGSYAFLTSSRLVVWHVKWTLTVSSSNYARLGHQKYFSAQNTHTHTWVDSMTTTFRIRSHKSPWWWHITDILRHRS